MEKYYKITEVANLLSVTRKTLYNWIKQGKLKTVYICGVHRIAQSELEKAVKKEGD